MYSLQPAAWLALTIACSAAIAQPVPQPTVAASGASAAASAPGYRSALEGYRPFADEKVLPWRESNDKVERIGGWRAYAAEAQGKSQSPAAAASAPPAPAPHAGHQH